MVNGMTDSCQAMTGHANCKLTNSRFTSLGWHTLLFYEAFDPAIML